MLKLLALCLFPSMALAYYPTAASDCSPIDLRDSYVGRIRNQDKLAWCYAFTSSDVLGHTFQTTEQISSADLALLYNESKVGRFARWLDRNIIDRRNPETASLPHQTGFTKTTLNQAMKNGWCPERVLPSERWQLMRSSGLVETKTLKESMLEIAQLHQNRATLTEENLPFYPKLKNMTPAVFVSILKSNKKLLKVYSALRHEVCKDDRQDFDTRWKVKMVFRKKNIFWRVSEQLEVGRLVSIDYDARILENRDHRGVKLAELHTSSIVGRRWNAESQSCQYLIRDSHGNQCSRYDQSYDCEGGQVWLSESQLYPSLTSIVYMLSGN